MFNSFVELPEAIIIFWLVQSHEILDGPPQLCERWLITPSKYSYLRIIHYCYYSYVLQRLS